MFSQYPDVMSVNDLKTALCIGRTKAYELVNSGAIKSIKVGSAIRIPKKSLLDYLGLGGYNQSEVDGCLNAKPLIRFSRRQGKRPVLTCGFLQHSRYRTISGKARILLSFLLSSRSSGRFRAFKIGQKVRKMPEISRFRAFSLVREAGLEPARPE